MENDPTDLGPRKKFAETLALRLLNDAGVASAPVNLRLVIEYIQKSRKIVVRSADFGEKVSGLLVLERVDDTEYATIGFNENHPWCRRRFTIAHEIGHLLLGHVCSDSPDNSHNEKEANTFASALLIPRKFVKSDFARTPNIQVLAKQYLVSEAAMTIGLMGARLV